MTEQLQIQPVKLDKDVLNAAASAKSATASDSHEFNKILSKQSDSNTTARHAENHQRTRRKQAAQHVKQHDDKQASAAASDSERTATKNGKDLPAKLPSDSTQDTASESTAGSEQSDVSDESTRILLDADAVPGTIDAQHDPDGDPSDTASAIIAAPQNIDVQQQGTKISAQQTTDTQQATIAVTAQANANALNQTQGGALNPSTDTDQQVTLTPAGIQKAIENQPNLPAQANAELRSVVKADTAPVAKISFRSPDTDTLQQLPLFDKLISNTLQPVASKTHFNESLLNFTTKTERVDTTQVATSSAAGADKILHNATPLPGGDQTATTAANQVRPSLELPVQHPQWGQELGNKAVWLVNHRLSEAQIHLNPKELGPIDIKINVQNDQATVHFSTHHHGVRESIESAIPRLRDALAEQGLNLADVNVAQQDAGHAQSGGFGQAYQGSTGGGGNGLAVSEDTEHQQLYSTDFGQADDRIDYYA